jgi:hypothetical protein
MKTKWNGLDHSERPNAGRLTLLERHIHETVVSTLQSYPLAKLSHFQSTDDIQSSSSLRLVPIALYHQYRI